MQVGLAYGGASSEAGLSPSAPNVHASDPNTTSARALPTLATTPTSPTTNPSPDAESTTGQFYHVVVDVRQFAASPCAPGETCELYFSLYNKADARFVTEEFCVILNAQGNPVRENEAGVGSMRTLFRDLSQHDVHDHVFLVCRIVKNGGIKQGGAGALPAGGYSNGASTSRQTLSPVSLRSDSGSFDTTAELDYEGGHGMLHTDRSGRQTYRRPFGCAVLEISQFTKSAASDEDQAGAGTVLHQMAIFVPANEANFSTLHEDIIASRLREIEKSPRAEFVGVSCRILFGEAPKLVRELPSLLGEVAVTNRIGFPDVVYPGDERNEVYLKLWSGEFSAGSSTGGTVRSLAQLAGSGGRNIEVTCEVRTKTGAVVERAISRGAGQARVTHYSSLVFRNNNHPSWGELVKLEVPVELIEDCHVFFTFRSRAAKDRGTVSGGGGMVDRPFAFGYLPLFPNNAAFQPDGSHHLVVYRYERGVAEPGLYLQGPSTSPQGRPIGALPLSISKSLIPTRDTMVVRTFLVSTRYTQNGTLLTLLRWEKELADQPDQLKDTLAKLKFCSEVEVCKFLGDIFDALFGILISKHNQQGEVDELVFEALVTILGIVSDRRFSHFKSVLDVYIARHFTGSTASSHILGSLHRLLRAYAKPEAGTLLRASIKAWEYLFKFVVRSREIQRAKDVGMGVTSDHLEATFKRELAAILLDVNAIMHAATPSSVIGTQTLAVQHFASILPDLAKAFTSQELADIAIAFGDAVTATRGKIVVWKLLFMNQLVTSCIFESPTGRAALVPNLVRWLKPALGKFDEHQLTSSKDSQQAKDNARVGWVEGIRLGVGVVGAMLDSIQEALVDPTIQSSRSMLGQEQDNIEYTLGLLPKLLDSFRELESLSNLDSVERQRNQASVVAAVPVVFPSSYPFSLLAFPPPSARDRNGDPQQGGQALAARTTAGPGGGPKTWPSLQAGVGEVGALFVALLLLAPSKIFVNWLEATLEVEGKDHFGRLLTRIFQVAKAILDGSAFPSEWLNINVLAHRVIVRILGPIADLLEREFIPAQAQSFTFQTALWRDFFAMLLRLLASPQLLIEDFSPQKQRAVWRLAGDIRGEGAKILLRLWDAIGWPEERAGGRGAGRSGGYQVQFVPGLVEDVLQLCLSHHDELRTSAVHVLHSMIVSEYYLNNDFAAIEAEVIDRLDKLFMSQTKGDDVSRAFFVGQLKTLFDQSDIDDRLRDQVDAFLDSINSFLDLLLSVRNLPEGDQFQEDRIISTLRLMTYIRQIGRSEIYVRYVNRLVSFHVALGHDTEAGLTLKLHADLHSWDPNSFVEALPDLDLPRQTEFVRKEMLYMRILEHLSAGKAWETALTICKELQHEYETRTFDYARLSELLALQGSLYASIAKGERQFGDYFRVAFFGAGWPVSVSGKQFVYRAAPLEKLGQFREKLQNKHPGAQVLASSAIPDDDVRFAEAQYLQITPCVPEPDRTADVFTKAEVPSEVRRYYELNDTQTFSFTRPVNKQPTGRTRVANEFTERWTEKTFLICEDAFPSVLRRSEVVEIRITELSPVENALNDVEANTVQLDQLERRYRALSAATADRTTINSNLLTMALNAVVDPPPNEGVPMYRRAFFGADFAAVHPEKAAVVRRLERAVDELVVVVGRCLALHGALCADEMRPFQETMEGFFERQFADELARLPPMEKYEVPRFENGAGLDVVGVGAVQRSGRSGSGGGGSISISALPGLRRGVASVSQALSNDSSLAGAAAGGHARRDSSATLTPGPRPASVASYATYKLEPTLTNTSTRTGRSLDPLDEAASPQPGSGADSVRSASRQGFAGSLRRGSLGGLGGGGGSQELGPAVPVQAQVVSRRPSLLGGFRFGSKRRESVVASGGGSLREEEGF